MNDLLKRCEHCGEEFGLTGKHRSSRAYFKKRRFCSSACASSATQPSRPPLHDRLLEKLSRGGEDECWEWRGARQRAGYGAINYKGRGYTTHRLSWEFHNGPIPDGMHVLHRCDNPPCCNPKHLFLGTQSDNNADKLAKGRARGRCSPRETLLAAAGRMTAA